MLGFFGAIRHLTGDINAASVSSALSGAKAIPLPMSGGATFTCDGSVIPALPSVCSEGVQMAVVGADGAPASPRKIDTSGMFAL